MVRGIIAGCTDYSNQSLEEMNLDIESWIKDLKKVTQLLEGIVQELKNIDEWNNVDFDFRASTLDLTRFFNNAVCDLEEVLEGIDTEIKQYHINLVRKLSTAAQERNDRQRKVWGQYPNKDYGEVNFKKIESLHQEASSMAIDMLDLSNLAGRLEDFVGKTGKKGSQSQLSERGVTNIFQGAVEVFQQNNGKAKGEQTINPKNNNENKEYEELRKKYDELNKIVKEIRVTLEEAPHITNEEINDSLDDLEEEIKGDNPKKSKVRSFGKTAVQSLKGIVSMKGFNNLGEISSKLPKMIDDIQNVADKL